MNTDAASPLEIVESIPPDCIDVLLQIEQDQSWIRVSEARGIRWLQIGGESVQSLMAIDAPAKLLLPNHIAMLFGSLLIDEPEDVLCMGLGGGCFERFFAEYYPHCRLTSVESNTEVISVARDYFGIPLEVNVASARAEYFIETSSDRFDLIFCDIFEHENHPECLVENTFYRHSSRCLKPGGVLVLNILQGLDNKLFRILKSLRMSFASVYLCTIDNRGNVIVVASNGKDVPSTEILRRTKNLAENSGVDMTDWIDRFALVPEKRQSV
ncbi:MAG: fused MFS/spermidine synthase [Granulosicoccus sp.]|nr:fused MFS/spermidine synthase [Granulosicoccus sp.]